ncbi:helix-turn-helix domain-containing protein [Paenibacillus hemerocallicola]|uniref:Helix-turn-helix domain-containing protein n=1 Tax=Paenibacillus hemerocallicola TaxID=1172614 RepID=A0A5C4SY29_9BACL|nr:helix-turn-helix domain-containing protein [Paenibacillus hemerocallicola]
MGGSPLQTDSFLRFHHAGDVTVKPGRRLGPRRIHDYELVYFPKSTRTLYTSAGVTYALDSPFALITRPGETHDYNFDPAIPTRHLFVHFDFVTDGIRQRYPKLLLEGAAPATVADGSLVPQLMKQLLYSFHHRPARWQSMAEMLLLTVMEEMEGSLEPDSGHLDPRAIPPQIANALQYIDTHANETIEVEQLAKMAGWSHEHFTRTFQRHVGHSPKEWMTKRRIGLAAQLLLQRSDSVKQIARAAGFADEYYFHRLFRRMMGMTATEYRRKYGDPRLREMAPPDDWGRFYPLNHIFILRSADKE